MNAAALSAAAQSEAAKAEYERNTKYAKQDPSALTLEQAVERYQLTPEQRQSARMFGQSIFAAGHGYGMGVAVVMEPAAADPKF